MKLKMTILLGMILATTLAACGPNVAATPTEAPEAIYTRVAETIQFNMTETALAMPSPTPTLESTATPSPTNTVIPLPTISGSQALTPIPTHSTGSTQVVQPTSGQKPNAPVLVTSQSPTDGSVFAPTTEFLIYWRLQNNSTATWTKDYYLGWYGGTQIWGVTKVPLDIEVAPGKFVEIYVHGIAPEKPGEYVNRWALYSSTGQFLYEVYLHFFVQ